MDERVLPPKGEGEWRHEEVALRYERRRDGEAAGTS
jgi:hypothetical protein